MTDTSQTIDVALGDRSYPILMTTELPGAPLAALARQRLGPKASRLLVVSDSNVAPLYAAEVEAALGAAGYSVQRFVFPAGEAQKNLQTAGAILDAALAADLTRHDALIALGGGVVGDLTGFAASVLHRGVAYLQVPTSLLAQVDSSVGGKTGVNHRRGKNLIGAFWQPRAVVASQAVLATLPARERRCGLAEAVKHAFIAEPDLLSWSRHHAAALAALEPAAIAHLVAACCRIKAAVVGADERDEGGRAVLNFGHTIGHAYENLLGYGALTHGEAVALGMVQAGRLSERLGVGPTGLASAISAALRDFGLPWDVDAPELPVLADLIAAAGTDKKADHGGVVFVLLEAVGRPRLVRLGWNVVHRELGRGGAGLGA